jgi:hypothetical protein
MNALPGMFAHGLPADNNFCDESPPNDVERLRRPPYIYYAPIVGGRE